MKKGSGFYSWAFTVLGIICGFSLVILLQPSNASVWAADATPTFSNESIPAEGDYRVEDSPQEVDAFTAASRSFSYQGVLRKDGQPINGGCNFKLSMWDALSGGIQLGSTQTFTTTVSSGQFNLVMNQSGSTINSNFDGKALWLATSVRCPQGSGDYTEITPRQALLAAPLASGLVPHTSIMALNSYSGNPVLKITALGGSDGGAYGNPNGLWVTTDLTPGIGATWEKVGVWADSYNKIGVRGTTATGKAIVGDSKTSIGHAGVFSGTVEITGNTVITGTLDVRGSLNSNMNSWQVMSTTGALPKTSNSFTTHGGTLLIFVSGSGFTNTTLGLIGMNVAIDGSSLGNSLIFANVLDAHTAFVSKQFVWTGTAAGSHTITLTSYNTRTVTDGNDFFNVTVLELPK